VTDMASVEIEEGDRVVVARVGGEIDLSNAGALGDRLASAVPNHSLGLVIDLAGTTYLDSSGIGLLFDLATRLRRRQQRLALAVPAESSLRRVLGIVDAGSAMPIAASVDEAAQRVRTGA
jgi:anti-sigma B factor antagonist